MSTAWLLVVVFVVLVAVQCLAHHLERKRNQEVAERRSAADDHYLDRLEGISQRMWMTAKTIPSADEISKQMKAAIDRARRLAGGQR